MATTAEGNLTARMANATVVGELPTIHPYRQWQEREGLPRYTGYYVADLNTLELGPWERKGGRGAFVNLEGTGGVNDMHVLEVLPGQSVPPERHMFEALVYVIAGRGSASVWYDQSRKQVFEWGTGSLFAIPLNAWYQFFNGSGSQPARLVMVTNAPTIMNLFHNDEFIFDNPFVFRDRFQGDEGYFSGDGNLWSRGRNHVWETNFIPDVRNLRLHEWKERGAGGRNLLFEIAHSSMAAHVSQFPVGTYKKAHRHGPGAHVIILDGMGYSTLWPEGAEPMKVDWHENGVVVPPANWFHQHFNTGPQPARYLAMKYAGRRYYLSEEYVADKTDVSITEGGKQIEFEDENPLVHQTFEAELTRNGAECHMRGFLPWCTAQKGPND